MQTLINTLKDYINKAPDCLPANAIRPLLEAERTQFSPIEWDCITRSLKPYEFENARGNQVFELLILNQA